MNKNIYARLATVGKIVGILFVIFVGARMAGILDNFGISGSRAVGDSYDEKMSAYRRTDSKLVLYKEAKRLPARLKQPRGIAVDANGKLYIAGDKAVVIYAEDFSPQGGFSLSGAPYCIAVSPNGILYVGMRDHIETFDSRGKNAARWSSIGKDAYITSISLGKDEVWVADAGSRSIIKYDQTGQAIAVFGKKDKAKGVPGIIAPSPHLDVVAANGGSVWSTNPGRHIVDLYNADGSINRSWGKTSFESDGFSGCCNPTDIAVTTDGRFITSEKGLPRVKIYDAKGKFQGIVAGVETFAPNIAGLDLAADAKGRIFVLDTASKTVRVYVPKDKVKP